VAEALLGPDGPIVQDDAAHSARGASNLEDEQIPNRRIVAGVRQLVT
jgi:hypothetical protein